ncbi:hypothetical protein [Herbidospora cretacea]|uniref:hypothetical protein n=1 Tax=Herbidospora cretacea TaxID=28444 RepID=UPI000773B049|nr:hypothetical protein [Herbidospora cretacea]
MGRLSRTLTAGIALGLLTACGGQPAETTARETPSRKAGILTQETAERAFAGLQVLDAAWHDSDCAEMAGLVAAPVSELAGSACAATAFGHKSAGFAYTEPEFYLPTRRTPGRPWFAVLAREPDPAYFVFTQAKGGWRLALGPVPVPKDAPEVHVTDAVVPAGDDKPKPVAGLVSQRCLTYLTDPTGVNGIRVSSGDPLRALRDEITRSATKYRPDRVSVDVRLVTGAPAHSLALPGGASLVFHTLRLVTTQTPGPGRDELVKPVFADADIRGFAGHGRLGEVTAEELLFLATRVDADGRMTTVGMGRRLASMTNA